MQTRIVEITRDGRTEYRLEVRYDHGYTLWGTYSHCERAFVEQVAARLRDGR